MKLPLSFWLFVVAGFIAPAGAAGQQSGDVGWGQKARPDPVAATDAATQADAQGLLDFAQTIIQGEEIMLIMDVPYVPAQQTPVVLAQADTSGAGATPQPDFILKECQETESTGDSRSAMRAVSPAGMLWVYLQNRDKHAIDLASIKNITLLEDTKHGELVSQTSASGLVGYWYDPEPEYVGNDRAVFMAEYQGVRYKIVVDLRVSLFVDEKAPVCPPAKLIKVTKPSSGANGYDLNSVSVTFADLQGAALGQTDATGITLDTNASGYGWFIDTTPGQNEERD